MLFRSSLNDTRLHSPGSMPESTSRDALNEPCVTHYPAPVRAMTPLHLKGIEQLQRRFKAQLSRQAVADNSGLRHGAAHEIVSQQMHRDFFFHHRRCLAAQDVPLHHGFDRTQIELDVPAAGVKRGELGFTHGIGIGQRADKRTTADAYFAHREGFGHRSVGWLIHPHRALGAHPSDEVVTRAEWLAATKIGESQVMRRHDDVNTARDQSRDQEIPAIVTIRDYDIALAER